MLNPLKRLVRYIFARAAAFDRGWTKGWDVGYDSGYSEGSDDGYTKGWEAGENHGYWRARESVGDWYVPHRY